MRAHLGLPSSLPLRDAKNMAKDIKDAFCDVVSSYIKAKGETSVVLCVFFTY